MSQGFSLACTPMQTLRVGQYLCLDMDAGELELLSLHRIKNRIPTLDVVPQVRARLVTGLVVRNTQDRRLNTHNRYSICPYDLDSTCDEVEGFLMGEADKGAKTLESYGHGVHNKVKAFLEGKATAQDTKIRNWFLDNYEHLIYDTTLKLPWPVIRRMRSNLEMWATGNSSALAEPVKEMVESLVTECGSSPDKFDSLEKMWDFLKTKD